MIVIGGVSVEAVVWTLMALVGIFYAYQGWAQANTDLRAELVRGAAASPTRVLLGKMGKTTAGTRVITLLAFIGVGMGSLLHGVDDDHDPVSLFGVVFEVLLFVALLSVVRAAWLELRRTRRLYDMYERGQ